MRDLGSEDLDAAAAFYRDVTDANARALLDFLIDHPDERLDEATLAERLGFPEHRAVARATYAMGQALLARGFRRPWTEAQAGYLMPAEMAALLGKARAATAT